MSEASDSLISVLSLAYSAAVREAQTIYESVSLVHPMQLGKRVSVVIPADEWDRLEAAIQRLTHGE